MSRKVLFVASVASHLESFHVPYFEWFQQQGFEVHAATHMNIKTPLPNCDRFIEIPFERSPYSKGNIKAYRMLKKTLTEGNYDLVHCHTPMAAALTRLAAKSLRKKGLKVIYTAHGFHFFKGAPKSGWLIYYPVEKWLSRYTDAIITINHEDYDALTKYNFRCKGKYLVPGIGVNTSRVVETSDAVRYKLREEYNIPQNAFILFYAAEFIPRKNQELIIRALPELRKSIPEILVIFAGDGVQMKEMESLAKELEVSERIQFLGYRYDIGNLIALSNIGVSASRQEGLPINVAEDMMTGLPVVVSYARGHNEMVSDGEDGFFFNLNKPEVLIDRILTLYHNPELRQKMGNRAKETIQKFSIENALAAHTDIYCKLLNITHF